jgi:3-hydroxyisobutyrate dehydrogenase-like beta-hydroxyacid dehydrogenase
MIVGFLHPGAMGTSLAATCAAETVWVVDGRSDATRQRADVVGMRAVPTLAVLAETAEAIVSVCPPGAAVEQAEAVAATGFNGLYADVNAVAPSTTRRIDDLFERFVDGGIIGPPVARPGDTRLYLAGHEAHALAALWSGSALDVRVLDGPVGAASALKACFASWTKGTAALLLAIRALASAEGVDAELVDEWAISIPDLPDRSERSAPASGPKAWRFEGEMRELAAAFGDRGLPPGFLDAAAATYARLAAFKDGSPPTLDQVVEALLARPDS